MLRQPGFVEDVRRALDYKLRTHPLLNGMPFRPSVHTSSI